MTKLSTNSGLKYRTYRVQFTKAYKFTEKDIFLIISVKNTNRAFLRTLLVEQLFHWYIFSSLLKPYLKKVRSTVYIYLSVSNKKHIWKEGESGRTSIKKGLVWKGVYHISSINYDYRYIKQSKLSSCVILGTFRHAHKGLTTLI